MTESSTTKMMAMSRSRSSATDRRRPKSTDRTVMRTITSSATTPPIIACSSMSPYPLLKAPTFKCSCQSSEVFPESAQGLRLAFSSRCPLVGPAYEINRAATEHPVTLVEHQRLAGEANRP